MVQREIYKNYWGHSLSTKQIQHIWTLNIEPKYTNSNIFQSSQDSLNSLNFPEFPASLQEVAGHNIPEEQGRLGQGVKQTEQGLNIVSNLSPHRFRKIACWIETGQFGLISEIGGAYGLQKEVLYPTQKCNHIFNPKVNDSLPKISGYELIAPFLKENQAAYITFANISGKECAVTIDSGCTKSVATSAWVQNIFSNFHRLLKPYKGTPFFTADNNQLKTLGVIEITNLFRQTFI